MPNFLTPFETLVEHCKENEIRCHANHGKKFIGFAMCGEAAMYKIKWCITHDNEMLQMDIALPVQARDEKMRPFVLETIARANHGLAVGHFNLDMSDGEITYHVSCPVGEAGLDDQTIGRLFGTAMVTCDRYFAALMRVMFGGNTPEDAIYLAELDVHSERVTDTKTSAPEEKPAPPVIPMAKKRAPRPRKKNPDTKPGDQTGVFDPSKGEGTDRPPKGR